MFGLSAPWLWVIAGVLLCAAEIFAPGAFLIWIGAAAIGVGLIDFLYPLPMAWSVIAFSALAVAAVLVGRRLYGAEEETGQPLNQRVRRLIGQTFPLDQPIENGMGRMQIGDSLWRVRGPEAPAGTRMRVTGIAEDGMTLIVEKA